jgi:hypothetical protein
MERSGGGFASALARAFYKADSTNASILYESFPHIFQMARYADETIECEGYPVGDPLNVTTVVIALGMWDGKEDEKDQGIYYYMDGEPLEVGMELDGLVITKVGE